MEKAPPAEFGVKEPGQVYAPRPGAYAVLIDAAGRIAVMQTPRGGYLPGGGCEAGETPEKTLEREVREECGFAVRIVRRVGEAVEYVYTPGHEAGIRKECVFFEAVVVATCGPPTETDHILLWLPPPQAQAALAHESQQWAVASIGQCAGTS